MEITRPFCKCGNVALGGHTLCAYCMPEREFFGHLERKTGIRMKKTGIRMKKIAHDVDPDSDSDETSRQERIAELLESLAAAPGRRSFRDRLLFSLACEYLEGDAKSRLWDLESQVERLEKRVDEVAPPWDECDGRPL